MSVEGILGYLLMEAKKAFLRKASVLLLFLVFVCLKPAGAFEINLGERTKAPEFALKDLNGKYVSIIALRGKVIVLNFWATWCLPCKDEMPSLDKLNSTYKDKGLVVVSVSLNNSVNRVKDFLEKVPVGFIVLLDEKSKVSRQYKVYSIPTTFVIDKGGFVVRKYQGPEDWVSPKITKTMEDLLR